MIGTAAASRGDRSRTPRRDRGRRSWWRGAARLMRSRKTIGLLDSRREGLVSGARKSGTVKGGIEVPSLNGG